MYSANSSPEYPDSFLDELHRELPTYDPNTDWYIDVPAPPTAFPVQSMSIPSRSHMVPPRPSVASSSRGFPQSAPLSKSRPQGSQIISSQIPNLLKLKVSSGTRMFGGVAGKDPFMELDLVQVFRTTVKFAKLLEDGRRLENLSWRLTFPGLASPGAGYSGSKKTANRAKTLAPQFDDGVLLHTTVTPGNVQGIRVAHPLVDVEVLDLPENGGRISSLPPSNLSGGGIPPSKDDTSRVRPGESKSAVRKAWSSGPQLGEATSAGRREDKNRVMRPPEISTTNTDDASVSGLRRTKACVTCRKKRIKCEGTRPICDRCSRTGVECLYRLSLPRVEPPQGPYQSPTTGSRREGHNSEFRGGTVDSSRGRRQTRTRPQDRGSRSCSSGEGHQSGDEEWESKKKVDWYDAQRTDSTGLPAMGGVTVAESGHWSQVLKEGGTHYSTQKWLPTLQVLPRSARQLHRTDFIRRARTDTTKKFNLAEATKEANQEYANLSAADKEKYERLSREREPISVPPVPGYRYTAFQSASYMNPNTDNDDDDDDDISTFIKALDARKPLEKVLPDRRGYPPGANPEQRDYLRSQRPGGTKAYMRNLSPEDTIHENTFQTAQRDFFDPRIDPQDAYLPQKPISAYFLFLQRVRSDPETVKEVFGNETDMTKQSILVAAKWHSMTDDERKPFLDKAEQDKLKYETTCKRPYGSGSIAHRSSIDSGPSFWRTSSSPPKSRVVHPPSQRLQFEGDSPGSSEEGSFSS